MHHTALQLWTGLTEAPLPPLCTTLHCSYGLGSLDEMCYGFLVVYDASPNATSSSAGGAAAAGFFELNYCVSEAFSMAPLQPSALICASVPEHAVLDAAVSRGDAPALAKLVAVGALQHEEAATNVSSAVPNGTGVPWVDPQCRQQGQVRVMTGRRVG